MSKECQDMVQLSQNKKEWKFPLTHMGVLATGSATPRRSARPPIDMSKNFRWTCLESHLQTSHPTLNNSCPMFQSPKTTFVIFLI